MATPEEQGVFEVTMQAALLPDFQRWLKARGMAMVSFGPNEEGTPTYVTGVRPGSALARRFEQIKKEEA